MASPYQLQQRMLARIRASLGYTGKRSAPPRLSPFAGQTLVTDSEKLSIEFESEIEKVGGQLARAHCGEQVTAYLEKLLPVPDGLAISDGPLIKELHIREWLLSRKTRVVAWQEMTSMDAYKRELLKCGVGITCADYGLADTGTLVLLSDREHHRLVSLLPPVHVCLLPIERIFASLMSLLDHLGDEFYARERPPQALTCITGPSRTADIEQTITTGVHGPKALHVLLYSTETIEIDRA